jgi:tetratricopeptide (TPR) repeat protein
VARIRKLNTPKKQKPIPDGKKGQGKNRKFPWRLISVIFICLMGAIAYSNSFDCSFHFDDTPNIEDNITIRNLSNVKAWWVFYPSRPIGYLSFALDYHFHKLDVWGYHLVNLAIHIVNAVLVWWLVMLTMATPVMKAQPISRHKGAMALFTALLFVSHPLATQSVTYIVQRLASLATLFYLLSLALYVKGRVREGNKDTRVYFYYAGSVLCAILGMLTKEIVFTLPFALVLYEFSFIRTDTWKFDLKDRGVQIPVIILVIFVALFFLNFSFEIFNSIPPLLNQGYDYPITAREYLLTQFSVILTYIRLFILPVNQNMDYDYPISHSLLEWHTLFGLLSLVGIFVAAIFLVRRYRLISFGIFWFFLTFSVESSVIPISQNVIFEHRTYLPSIGFFLALTGVVFYFIWDRYRQVSVGVLVLLVLTNAVLTYERNKVWKSEYSLWADCLKKSPNKPRPLYGYGNALADAGNASEALTYYNKAIAIQPRFYLAYENRGNTRITMGDYEGAVADYEEALKINPYHASGHYNLGNALALQGKTGEATIHLKEAIRLRPEHDNAQYNLGLASMRKGNVDEAMSYFQQANRMNPFDPETILNMGVIMARRGNLDRAMDYFVKALQIKPDYPEVHTNLGLALMQKGNLDEAVMHVREAIRLMPSNPENYFALGKILAKKGNLDEALADYSRALHIKPDYAEAHNNMGIILARKGKLNEAISHFRQAIQIQPDYREAHNNLQVALAQSSKIR